MLAVAIVLMLAPVVLNIISMQVAARVNNVAVFTEIIGTVVFGVLLFVLWGVKSKPSPYGFGILTNTTSVNHNPVMYSFALAGLSARSRWWGSARRRHVRGRGQSQAQRAARDIWRWQVRVLGMVALIGFTVAIPNLKAVEASPLPLLRSRTTGCRPAGEGVHRLRDLLDVRDPGGRRRCAGPPRLLDVARQHAPVLRLAARSTRAPRRPIVALLVFAVIDVGVT